MPITKSPFEYYRYYCASQRRVEEWIQDTALLQTLTQSPTTATQWLGFLEDPGLATPISPARHLDERKDRHLLGSNSQSHPQLQIREAEPPDQAHVPEAPCAAGDRATLFKKGDHDDLTPSSAGEKPITDRVPALPSSSKHSKGSKQSRHTSKSKNSSSRSSRKRQSRKEDDVIRRSFFVYVPYGVIPLLLAMTTGSSALSLAAASIMLAGYFCLDFTSTVSLSSLLRFAHDSELVLTAAKKTLPKVTKLCSSYICFHSF